jgi:hypothetical protein
MQSAAVRAARPALSVAPRTQENSSSAIRRTPTIDAAWTENTSPINAA